MIHVNVFNKNENYVYLDTDRETLKSISKNFEFYAENYFFHPKYKAGMWSGKINLLNLMTQEIYKGLLPKVIEFCEENDISYNIDKKCLSMLPDKFWSKKTVNKWSKILETKFPPRDYQCDTVLHCINNGRCIIESATSSGKSFSIYLLTRYYNSLKKRVLIIVPRSGLVKQMKNDFVDYNNDKELDINRIPMDSDPDSNARVTVTTWQSIKDKPKSWFKKFGVVIGDEVHAFKAKSLIKIMLNCGHIPYRFGFTGSLKLIASNLLTVTGLFGTPKHIISVRGLIEIGSAPDLKIKCIRLHYPEEICEKVKNMSYAQEINFLENLYDRNDFLVRLAQSFDKNTLIFFRKEDHGKNLFSIAEKYNKKTIHFSNGKVKLSDRDDIKKSLEASDDNLGILSLGTFSTGESVNNIHNLVLGRPIKSEIDIIQSIGRSLRNNDNKNEAYLYDISDNLCIEDYKNYSYKHSLNRMKTYRSEKHPYEVFDVKLTLKNL